MSRKGPANYRGRRITLLGAMIVVAGGLVWRAVDLQILHKEFLQGQGDARHLRVVSIPAHRGMITDRHGEPLAATQDLSSVDAPDR